MLNAYGFNRELVSACIKDKLNMTGGYYESGEELAIAVVVAEKLRKFELPALPRKEETIKTKNWTLAELEAKKRRHFCRMCNLRRAHIVALPCNHMVLCRECLNDKFSRSITNPTCCAPECGMIISRYIEAFIA
jgi:hypothetical protein